MSAAVRFERITAGLYATPDWQFTLEKTASEWVVSERGVEKHGEPTLAQAMRWARAWVAGEVITTGWRRTGEGSDG